MSLFDQLATVLTATIALSGCAPECDCGERASAGASRDDQWRADVRCLARGLAKCHIAAFAKTDRGAFEQQAAALEEQVPSLSDGQVTVELARLAARLGDSHTALSLSRIPGFHYLPLRLYGFTDGWFVVDASPEHSGLVARRLVKVGSTPVADAMAAVAAFISHESSPWLEELAPYHLVTGEVLAAAGIAADPSEATLWFEGQAEPVVVAAADAPLLPSPAADVDALPLYRRHPERNYWFEQVGDGRSAYLQYNRCAQAPDESFGDMAGRLFELIDRGQVERLTVDLRRNTGGNSEVARPLLDGLPNRPAINQPGRLFVLVGRATFSSGVLNAIELKQRTAARLAGEPSGGTPNSYGNIRYLELPNSKLQVSYSTKRFSMMDGDPVSLLPDAEVRLSSADYFSLKDPVTDWVAAQ